MSGLGVAALMASGVGVGVGAASGSAATGFENDSIPAARRATPIAVSTAGTMRVRKRSRKAPMGRAS